MPHVNLTWHGSGRDSLRWAAMEWSDEGVVLSVRPHGETAAVAGALHARARPASGAGARRALAPAAARAADRQPRRRHLEGAAGRQPGALRHRAAPGLRRPADGGCRGARRHHLHGGAGAPAARARPASQPVRDHAVRAGLSRRRAPSGRRCWCAGSWPSSTSWASGSTSPPAPPPATTRRPDLRLAAGRAARSPPRPASPTRTGCWPCRRSCAAATAGAVSEEDVRPGSR